MSDRQRGHCPRDHRAPRNDLTAKGYGGDAVRKRKLLEAELGEEAHARFGKVDIPTEAFIAALKMIVEGSCGPEVEGQLSN